MTYEYRCTDCGHKFDYNDPFAQPSYPVCPECAGDTEIVIAPVPFKLAWYTPYHSKGSAESDRGY